MKTYQIEPMAPLVFRSGRPFGEGSRDGANFPWPSSVAGMLRTASMDRQEWQADGLSDEQQTELLKLAATGPFLARRQGKRVTVMVPKPADGLYLLENEKTVLFRLAPGSYPAGCGSDLPAGLSPVVLDPSSPKSKPQKGPEFWPLDRLLAWRRNEAVEFGGLADAAPLVETRTHVGIDRASLAAASGKLFQVQGLDFGRVRKERGGYGEEDWLLLAGFEGKLSEGSVTLGGERRLSWLASMGNDPLVLPEDHAKALRNSGGLAITLATPALFEEGWKPAWLGKEMEGEVPGIPGLKLRLKAAAVERWQGVSGWDLKKKTPKLARKAVAAGATYWFEIIGTPQEGWEKKLWLAPLSDSEQDRLDGFGLAIAGPWDTQLVSQ
jgi:CRISPR-associated protein Cmr3